MEKMGTTLGIDIYTDVKIYFNINLFKFKFQMFITYFLFRCQCKNYGEITPDEYSKGLSSFNVSSLADVKQL